jgi:chemotaxis response regulator CheB
VGVYELISRKYLPPIDQGAIDLDPEAKTDAPFPVVGIAASAGGLEAFIQLLKPYPQIPAWHLC